MVDMSLLERMEKLRAAQEGGGETPPATQAPSPPPAGANGPPAETAPPQPAPPTPPAAAPPAPGEGDGGGAAAPPAFGAPPDAAPAADAAAGPAEPSKAEFYELKHQFFDQILAALANEDIASMDEDGAHRKVGEIVDKVLEAGGAHVNREQRNALEGAFYAEIVGLGPLDELLNDPTVGKITVNSPAEVFVERFGKLEPTEEKFRDDDHLLSIIERIAKMLDSRIDSKVPLLDRPLPDGTRVRAKIPPIAPSGPTLSIDNKGTGNPFQELRREQARQAEAEAQPFLALKERVQQRLVAEIDITQGQADRERLRTQIQEMIAQAVAEENVVLSRAERSQLQSDLENEILGFGPIQPLLNDPEVSEIMINSRSQVYCERSGKLTLSDVRFRDDEHVMQIIEKIVAPLGRRVDEKSPMVDARLPDGSRVNAIIPPLALNGPSVTIRKFSKDPFTISDLINFGSVTNEVALFLRACVEARMNCVVSGGTGSGKTTLLNVLSSFIPADERIVTIEDAAELQLRQDHVVRLESRPPNIEGQGEITIRDLVKNSLRMRPDRIVIGECRGGEALDMLQAMNTGHDGSLTTAHANSPREMLSRLETLVLMAGMDLPLRAIREQIAGAVDLIIQISRVKDGTRKVINVTEIVGMEGDVITMQDLFVYEQEGLDDAGKVVGQLVSTGLRPKCYDRIVETGIKLPLSVFQRK